MQLTRPLRLQIYLKRLFTPSACSQACAHTVDGLLKLRIVAAKVIA